MTDRAVQVVIIGAGVVGCSIAFALAKRGFKTLNIDKLPAAGYGSTSHSSAIVRPIYSHTTSAAIAHESRSYWQDWENFIGPDAPGGYAQYHECGGLVLIREGDEKQYEANLTAMAAVGVDYQMIDQQQLNVLYPGICLDSFGPPKTLRDEHFGEATTGQISSAILVEAAGYVSDPQQAAQNLAFAANCQGSEFQYGCEVVEINHKQLTLDSGESISFDLLINAAGPHSGRINNLMGVELPIQTRPLRHEVAYVSANNQHFKNGARFLVDLDCGVYQRPDGADMVIGSADPDCDGEDQVDPDSYFDSFTEQWTLQTLRAAQRFPDLAIPNTARGTVGIYDVSEDWIPIYDRTEIDGYFVAIGTSGNQFKNAPLIGEVMAQIIERGDQHDTRPASLFLQHIEREIDLGFFSRQRTVQNLSGVLA
ncbi:MAG: sarcosine oxidase subunit beta [Candidatus Azotimanducaceae bacterium]|jgi:sarcosine oxidase subunit beta